ncbi:dGTPase [Alkalispirochaeta americana]|uniref:dGTPase n=1 Tax=Alkalispirochaeta americana TaxID=159291 RepID=A0A1N6RAM8_9SPIO|nr:HD domain-containing protein [Alkalispirochaeta americana]SIQ25732.1 dGTPase [Alkalispirochaeta americana]
MNPEGNLFFQNTLGPEELRVRPVPRPGDARDLRGHFFRDTTAIIHCYAFRRMKHKTQVFFAPRNDHICTRIEHVMHVSTIAAGICRALHLDVDLAWAIGMGHDLGHSPFGHLGERILSRLRGGQEFRHEMYSLRVVDHLANHGRGLNLTYAVRDGIINHCGEKFEQQLQPDHQIKDLSAITTRDYFPSTWEGVVVRMADKIAYLGRDLEDAMQLGMVRPEDIPREGQRLLGTSNAEIIDALVNDLIRTSLESGVVGFSDDFYQAFVQVKDFNYRHIYTSPALTGYHQYFERILSTLFAYLRDIFDRHGLDQEGYRREHNTLAVRFGDYLEKMRGFYEQEASAPEQVVFDYLAGMTDDFAIESVQELMMPRQFFSQYDHLELGVRIEPPRRDSGEPRAAEEAAASGIQPEQPASPEPPEPPKPPKPPEQQGRNHDL